MIFLLFKEKQLYFKLCVQLYSRTLLWDLTTLLPLQGSSRKIFTRNNRLAHFYPDYYLGQQTHLMLMERFPFLIYCGAAILAYTAGKMVTHEDRLAAFFITIQVSLQAFPIYSFSLFYASALSYNKFDYAM